MEWNDGLKELNIKMLMAVLGKPVHTRRFSAGNDGKFEQQTKQLDADGGAVLFTD